VCTDRPAEFGLAAAAGLQVVEQSHVVHFSAVLKQTQAVREFTPLARRYEMAPMPTIDEIRRENLAQLVREFGTLHALSLHVNKSDSQISQWLNASADSKSGKPRRISTDSCRALEIKVKKPPGWMDEQHAPRGEAHDLSDFRPEDGPHVEWGDIMQRVHLPRLFWAALPDDSMTPRAPAGKMICFDSSMAPKPGDGVLVADSSSGVYFRVYRAGAGGRWTAHAINPAFADLDSERDGLRVLAVLKAEEGRWG
jgi:hypothetical protein